MSSMYIYRSVDLKCGNCSQTNGQERRDDVINQQNDVQTLTTVVAELVRTVADLKSGTFLHKSMKTIIHTSSMDNGR